MRRPFYVSAARCIAASRCRRWISANPGATLAQIIAAGFPPAALWLCEQWGLVTGRRRGGLVGFVSIPGVARKGYEFEIAAQVGEVAP